MIPDVRYILPILDCFQPNSRISSTLPDFWMLSKLAKFPKNAVVFDGFWLQGFQLTRPFWSYPSAQFVLRKYLGLPLLSNTKFSKFKSPRFSSSCFLRNSNLGKTKLVCVAHLLEELKTSNSNSKF